jgi:hypothetical protein
MGDMKIELTDDTIVTQVTASLKELTMDEIYRSLRLNPKNKITIATPIDANAAKVGAFMLGCCLLETVSGFCFRNGGQSGFEQICKKYLENIDARYKQLSLYGALRSGLMHSYSPWEEISGVKHRFWLTDGDADHHLKPVEGEDQTYLLNLQNFIVDVETVLEQFLAKLPNNEDKCRENLIIWAKQKGWMTVSTVPVYDFDGNLLRRSASGAEFYNREPPPASVSANATVDTKVMRAKKTELDG